MGLTDSEKYVYAYVRSQAKAGKRPTIDEVAQQTGVPRSSVARVAKRLGYKGWKDFTLQLERYFRPEEHDDAVTDSTNLVADVLVRYRDQPILIDAIGDVEICVDYLLLRLGELGLRAMVYGRGVAESLASSNERAVLLLLNESGMALMPACLFAAERGFEVIAITASHDTPISKLADVNVVIKNNKSNVAAYEPNYFTAGTLSYLERVMAAFANAVRQRS